MAIDKKISQLPVVTTIEDTDLITTVRPGDPVSTKNKQTTGLNLKNSVAVTKEYSGLTTFNKKIQSSINELNAYQAKIEKDISYFSNASPTQTLTTSGAGDLATKIGTLVDGDILEIQVSASYSSITIPSGIQFAIRVAEGYDIELNGAQGITLNNGATNVFLSGFIFDSNTGGSNSKGSAICFQHEAIVQDITFHNCAFRNNDTSAIVLSYHQAIGGDNYTVPNDPSEFSDRVTFVGCHFHKAADEPIEGASIVMRGINLAFIKDCWIDGQDLCRLINIVNSTNAWVVNNRLTRGGGGGNGEGFKIDRLGSPSYFNSCYCIGNHVTNCIEGIDIDDTVSAFVINNKVSGCSTEGISLDDSSKGVFIGNISYNNNDGIRFETGSVGQLKHNYCYNNTNQNYRMDNGFTPDDSNSTSIQDSMIGSDTVPYDNTISGFNSTLVKDALDELYDSQEQEINSGFSQWTSGTDPNTYTVDGTGFQVDRAGEGYIQGKKISWIASQKTGVLSTNNTTYIYIDSSGLIQSTTTRTNALYENNIVLFECLFDGTIYETLKENHPYDFQTRISDYLHDNVGTVIQSTGAIVTRVATGTGVSADDRRIKTVGVDVVEDHGLPTTIPETNPVTWNVENTNGSGAWVRNSQNSELPMLYNNAGTPTAITLNQRSIYTLYISKDDIETATPKFFVTMDTSEYASLVLAQTAIINGTNARQTNELVELELAQLGYAIVRNNASGGYIEDLIVAKDTFNSKLIGGAVTGDHNLLNGLQKAASGVNWGHIDDQAQTIAGDKTLSGTTTLSALTIANGILQTDVNGVLSSSITLPDGTLATTQSSNDNSTKLATTAYVENAVIGEDFWDRTQIRVSPAVYVIEPNTSTDGIALNGFMANLPDIPSAVKYFQGLFDVGSSVPAHRSYLYSPNSTYPSFSWTLAVDGGSTAHIAMTLDITQLNIGTKEFFGGDLTLNKSGIAQINNDFVTITNTLSGHPDITGTENSILFRQERLDSTATDQGRTTFGAYNNWINDADQQAYYAHYVTRNGSLLKTYSIYPDPVYASDHIFDIEGNLQVNANSATPVHISNGHMANSIYMVTGTTIFTVVNSCLIDQDLRISTDPTWAGINSIKTGSVGANLDLFTLTNRSHVGADLTGTETSILWKQHDTTDVARNLGRITYGCEDAFTDTASTQDSYCKINILQNGVFANAMHISSNKNITLYGDLSIPGKLTVGGIIDPTALVLDPQSSVPSTVNGTIYYNNFNYFSFRVDTREVILESPAINRFRIGSGVNLLDMLANLTVVNSCTINQDLGSATSPSWLGLNLTDTTPPANGLTIDLATPLSTYETGIGVDNNNKFIYNADADGLGVYSAHGFLLMLDSDNDSEVAAFRIKKDSTNYSGGFDIFDVSEDGKARLNSPSGVPDNFALFTNNTTDLNDQAAILFAKNGGRMWQIGSRNEIDAPNDRLAFFNGTPTEKFTILQNGNVGIGVIDPNSTLDINGNLACKVKIVTNSAYIAQTETLFSCFTNGSNQTITIPAAAAGNKGRMYWLHNDSTSTWSYSFYDGSSIIYTATPGQTIFIFSDGSNWVGSVS